MTSPVKALAFSVVAGATLVALLYWNPDKRPQTGSGTPLVVYCAAGIKPPMEAVAREYEQAYGTSIHLQYGGSGTLLSNLRVARKGDLFLAADDSYLELARSNHLVAEVIPIARLTPVIAVARGNPKNIRSIADLLRPDVSVALANPDAAAIGKITRDQLRPTGQWTALESHAKVFKPTVNDVANDIKIGTVDAGILWDATVRQYEDLEAIPSPILNPAVQRVAIGVLQFSEQPTAALHFARYLGARDRGLKVFEKSGYQPVDGDAWSDRPEVVLFSGGVNRLAIEETIRKFEEREGAHVTRVYNGCGILVSQMKAGQNPDAYFACDLTFMNGIEDRFATPTEISETPMVMLVPKGNPRGITDLGSLTQPGLKLGVANAEQSALGALTVKLLDQAGLREPVEANVKVRTPTADLLVNQIRTGALDVVIVYQANTSQVRDVLDVVPLTVPGAIAIQPYAIGRSSRHPHLMERLLDTIRSAESRAQFESVGFRWRGNQPVP